MTDRSFLSVIVFCIRNPLIFHGVSPAAMIYELMRCFAAYQFSTHSQSVDFPRGIARRYDIRIDALLCSLSILHTFAIR